LLSWARTFAEQPPKTIPVQLVAFDMEIMARSSVVRRIFSAVAATTAATTLNDFAENARAIALP